MNKLLEDYREQFIEENDHYEKVYLSKYEQDRLNQQVIEKNYKEGNPFEEYYYEETEDDLYRFYDTKPMEVSDSELNQYISMKMLEVTKEMNEKQNTIKDILIFWLILTIISIIGSIYTVVKIGKL